MKRPSSAGITELGTEAFDNCESLESISFLDNASILEYGIAINWLNYAHLIAGYGFIKIDGLSYFETEFYLAANAPGLMHFNFEAVENGSTCYKMIQFVGPADATMKVFEPKSVGGNQVGQTVFGGGIVELEVDYSNSGHFSVQLTGSATESEYVKLRVVNGDSYSTETINDNSASVNLFSPFYSFHVNIIRFTPTESKTYDMDFYNAEGHLMQYAHISGGPGFYEHGAGPFSIALTQGQEYFIAAIAKCNAGGSSDAMFNLSGFYSPTSCVGLLIVI